MSTTLYAQVVDPLAQSTNYLIDVGTLQPIVIPSGSYLKYVTINKATSTLTANRNIVVSLENDIDMIKQSDAIDTTLINTKGVKCTLGTFKYQLTANRQVILSVSGDVTGTLDISVKYESY